jgi:ribosomal protein L11 methyltransferase
MTDGPTTLARVNCDEPTARRFAGYLAESLDAEDTVCAAFEGDGGQWRVEIHFRTPPDQAAVRALAALVAGEQTAAALIFEPVAAADWVAASLAGLTPVEAGRFVVHGAHDRARIKPNRIGIEIEAALAFGTGHHGTTRGCLLALDDLAKRRRNLPIPPLKGEGRSERSEDRGGVNLKRYDPHPARGACHRAALRAGPLVRHPPPYRGREKRVLDLGTGSGVLAIAAARAMHASVTATDVDPFAVAAARANARLNRAGPMISFARANGCGVRFVRERAPYDLIMANILLGPLMRMAAPLSQLAVRGGRVVLSGLLPGHANAVLAIYRAQGLALERRIALDGWVTLVLRKG